MDSSPTFLFNTLTAVIGLLLTVVGFLLVFVLNHILQAIAQLRKVQEDQQRNISNIQIQTAGTLATKAEIHELWVEVKELRELHKATYDHILQVLMEIKVSLANKVDKDDCAVGHRSDRVSK